MQRHSRSPPARARQRGPRSSRVRRTSRRIRAISASQAPPPLVNTIVGTRTCASAFDDRAHRCQREAAIGVGGEQARPTCRRSSPHRRRARSAALRYCVTARALSATSAAQQIGTAVRHPAHGGEVGAAAALDHVARERERAARESDQRHAAGELALDLRDRVEDVAKARACRAPRARGSPPRRAPDARSADLRLRRT